MNKDSQLPSDPALASASGSGVALPPTQIWLQWDGDYEYVRLPREESLAKLMRWIAGRDGKNGATTATMIHRKLLAMGLEHQNS